ncbi:DoxX family protein [Leptospira idonii]|uniref:DoxX family protein n=1 Tax=Leptospira idonii TaxID=1193500 RepID=A0A4V3JY64_9LEPT|nr:DoxX family protein [Leptospira idonii]TGN20036.1 DoxX family protein [Leptospira idonii]
MSQDTTPIWKKINWKVALYWIVTVPTAASFLFGGFVYLSGDPTVAEGMKELGYPSYFPIIIGVWKLLGGIAILVPRFALVKEWAYAGMFFNLSSASISCAYAGLGMEHIITPLVVLVFVAASWALRPASRRLV